MARRLLSVFSLFVLACLLWVLTARFHPAIIQLVDRYAVIVALALIAMVALFILVFLQFDTVQQAVLGFLADDHPEDAPAHASSWYVRDALRAEARETIDQQIAWVNGIDDKAMRTLRFNVLILGGLISGVSVLLDRNIIDKLEEVTDPFLVTGVLALVGSTALAALTYTASSMKVGLSSDDIQSVHKGDLSEKEYHDKLMTSYEQWIHANRRTIALNSDLVTFTILLLVYGTVFTVLGFLSLLPITVGDPLILGSSFTLAAMTIIALWY